MPPPSLHSLLVRQLKRVFGEHVSPPALEQFVAVVDEAYRQFDDDRLMLERSLDLSSEELFHANAELRALFQALPDLVLRTRADGEIVGVKSGYDRDLYMSADLLVGLRLQDAPLLGSEKDTERVLLGVLARNEPETLQYQLDIKGHLKSYEARLLPFLDDQVLVVVRDITDRVTALEAVTEARDLLEARVAERTIELRETNQALVAEIREREEAEVRRRALETKLLQAQKLESLGVMAGGIAHDFNNLLMTILGNASLGLNFLSEESPARRHLEEVQVASQRAAGLAGQMLAYSGQGRFVVESIDVSDAVRSMASLLEVSISKKAKLIFELSDHLPSVEADATQVGQVVMNLITNASEALGEGGGLVTLRTDLVSVDSDYLAECAVGGDVEVGSFVLIEVSDDGQGMDKETMMRIFDPFFTTKFTGRGLGLAAVLGIVRGHGGAMRVASAPGKGTRFSVLFPAVGAPAESRAMPDAVGTKGTILIVDDDLSVRQLLKTTLELQGYRALTAEDGRDGLTVFQRHEDTIVCVVLDMTMPVMDGRQAYERIREISPSVPVVIISGYAREEAQKRFEDGRYLDFLQKPFRLDSLVHCVGRFVEQGWRASEVPRA